MAVMYGLMSNVSYGLATKGVLLSFEINMSQIKIRKLRKSKYKMDCNWRMDTQLWDKLVALT